MSIVEINSTEIIHRASQYIAAAAISCLEKKDDDSHTNFGWNSNRKAFDSRRLNENDLYLSFSLQNFRLELLRNNTVLASKPLAGLRHSEILVWISEIFKDLRLKKPFNFKFHYDLPYSGITNEFIFESLEDDELLKQIELRDQSYKVLKDIAKNLDENAEVRTWPHHFDTGTFINVGNKSSIGLGLAIPDSMINDYYYYVSGWKGNEMMPVSALPKLKYGMWMDGDWKGAVLKSPSLDDETLIHFLKEAIDSLN